MVFHADNYALAAFNAYSSTEGLSTFLTKFDFSGGLSWSKQASNLGINSLKYVDNSDSASHNMFIAAGWLA